MSEPTSVVGVENKEECNKSAGSTASGRSQEAAVNKKEGRYKAANLKACSMMYEDEQRGKTRMKEDAERIDVMKMKMKTIDER
jgi:hypothetical protein